LRGGNRYAPIGPRKVQALIHGIVWTLLITIVIVIVIVIVVADDHRDRSLSPRMIVVILA
jgi:hypothetical protein